MSRKARPGALVAIRFRDMESAPWGWKSFEEYGRVKQQTFLAAGYVVKWDRRQLVFSPVMHQNERDCFGVLRVPTGALISVKKIGRHR